MPILTERKKSDREKMSAILAALVAQHGGTAEIENAPFGRIAPQSIMVRVSTPRGLECAFEFDGESSQPDTYVNAWNMSTDCDTCLSNSFPGSVNNFHFRKSTTVCEGFDALCAHVVKVLDMAADGSAFDARREAAKIAADGTWQERKAHFTAYLAEARAIQDAAAA